MGCALRRFASEIEGDGLLEWPGGSVGHVVALCWRSRPWGWMSNLSRVGPALFSCALWWMETKQIKHQSLFGGCLQCFDYVSKSLISYLLICAHCLWQCGNAKGILLMVFLVGAEQNMLQLPSQPPVVALVEWMGPYHPSTSGGSLGPQPPIVVLVEWLGDHHHQWMPWWTKQVGGRSTIHPPVVVHWGPQPPIVVSVEWLGDHHHWWMPWWTGEVGGRSTIHPPVVVH
jgi:hypothetical protein